MTELLREGIERMLSSPLLAHRTREKWGTTRGSVDLYGTVEEYVPPESEKAKIKYVSP